MTGGFGALAGADRTSREMALFNPRWGSPDQIVNQSKAILDARSNDTAQDDALAQAAVTTRRDSIVGARYALSCKPLIRTLGVAPDHPWVEDFQATVEGLWNITAESDSCWLDASRRRTMTEMCRQAASSDMLTGEILAPVEWIRDVARPCKTAVHLISPARLCNPNEQQDNRFYAPGIELTRGIEKDQFGRHVAYNIRQGFVGEWMNRGKSYSWARVPAELPWGRKQMIYICEPLLVEQTRGLGDLAVGLPHMRMSAKHGAVALQNAIVNATYAAAIESDLPPPEIAIAMGATGGGSGPDQVVDGWQQALGAYLAMIGQYLGSAPNVAIDGAKMPVLPPGTKFKLLNAGNGGNNFESFQATIDRKAAAALNMSYEEYTRDYSRLSYSGGKMSSGKTERFMNARKAITVDRFASSTFTLWLEEMISSGQVPIPPTWSSAADYYLPFQKDAISNCAWIGTGKGQIDELKETQAAILRIKSGLSTWEAECARLGIDYREMAEQQSREQKLFTALDLVFAMDASRDSGGATAQSTLSDTPADGPAGGD